MMDFTGKVGLAVPRLVLVLLASVVCCFQASMARDEAIGIVGMTTDFFDPSVDKDSDIFMGEEYYALKRNYFEALERACTPRGIAIVMLPITENEKTLEMYEDVVDGILFPGNRYDVDPKVYGEKNRHPGVVKVSEYRMKFELSLFERFMAQSRSMMGICFGAQMMNVGSGGSLYQDIPTEVPSGVTHMQSYSGSRTAHRINFNTASYTYGELAKRVKSEKLKKNPHTSVNSFHHQGVKNLATGFEPVAFSEDGVNEAYEYVNDDQLLLGMQWHPEFGSSGEVDEALFDVFCERLEHQIKKRKKEKERNR